MTLSSRIYKESRSLPKNKNTGSSSSYDGASGDDGLFVPFLLDTGPPVGVAPLAVKDRGFSESPNATPPSEHGMQPTNREYFQRKPALPTGRDVLREATRNASRSSSRERREVAIDERARQLANPINESVRRKRGGLDDVSPARPPRVQDPAPRVHDEANSSQAYATISSGQAEFKLQDVPKNRKAGGSRRGSKTDSKSPSQYSPSGDFSSGSLSPPHDFSASSFSPDSDKGRKLSAGQIMQNLVADPQTRGAVERPKRGDSLQAKQTLEVASVQSSGPTTPIAPVGFAHDRSNSSQSSRHAAESAAPPHLNGKMISQPMESPASRAILELPTAPPARSSSRPAPPDTFTSPRHAPHPPPPPSIERHKPSESTSTMQSDATSGLNLPRYSTGGDFSMEEDMARILRGDEGHNEPGVLRKMSNAVKHGRSFSDRGTRSQASSARWSGKSPMNGLDISSPTTAQSPDAKEDSATLRNELRRARQRITELEAEKNTIMHQSADLSEVSSQLQDKRNTMAFLNSQREIVVRELEIMTEHLQKAKDSNQPVNLKTLKTEVLHDLTYSIQRLKENLSKDVELLVKQKDDLTDEISKLIAMKDKGFQEYESLSSRNAQLTQHNNELIHGIQDFYKANRQPNGTSFDGGRPFLNGLGIQMHKDRPDGPSDARSMHGSESTVPGMSHDTENESVISTPKVIDIRKAPKGNMLKKGTQGFLRGVKGAFNADKERGIQRGSPFQTEGVPYNQMSETTLAPKSAQEAPGRQKFGAFFGVGDKANSSKVSNLKHSHFNNSSPSLASDAAGGAILFGIDLTTRCEMEKRVIPGIVTRCIEEVELRGMDVEGIYRKSGGNSQVNQVKGGFEANNEYDISDIELDIHAITSTLKQYFRRLPMPLISYDVYDPLLAAVKQEDTDVRIDKMRQCMDQLPRCHRDCLEFLMFHLSRVMEKEKYNLVSFSSAVCSTVANYCRR